ncbi:MAG: beta-galactosidase [bacterium]|nr:beta-galactosidase [bacterium]MDD5353585.1 beta-galactosidase [bacterium]
MNRRAKKSVISDGVMQIDGQPDFCLSADYPYYRDYRADWAVKLSGIKKLGIKYVSFYIPWRHHLPRDPFAEKAQADFTGEDQGSADIKYLLHICQKLELRVIAKPGPFVHAELNFGGLPEYVRAGKDTGIEPMLNADGKARTWSGLQENALPAPLDRKFLRYVQYWLETVTREILAPWQYPRGPIVAVQILNEGIYSDAGQSIDAYDYSDTAVERYQLFLKKKYKSLSRLNKIYGRAYKSWERIDPPRQWAGVKRIKELIWYRDWAEFSGLYIPLIISEYRKYMKGIKIPFLTNYNPPGPTATLKEAYFARNNPRTLAPVAEYGFTNWLGVIYKNHEDYCRYRLLARKARGICLEENWGFSKLYDPAYEYCQPSYFQSMAYIAFGATGLNIYTAAATDHWTKELDANHYPPYPHHPPIKQSGLFRQKYWTLYQMTSFFNQEGPSLVREQEKPSTAWGLYTPYCQEGAWHGGVSSVHYGWDSFLRLLSRNNTESGLAYLKEDNLNSLLKHKIIFTNGYEWMDRATQRTLAAYINKGGILVLTGTLPVLDENMEPYTILKQAFGSPRTERIALAESTRVMLDKNKFTCRAHKTLVHVFVQDNADLLAQAVYRGKKINCGYILKNGRGKAVYLGYIPWLANDNIWTNEGLVEYLLDRLNVKPVSRAVNCSYQPRVEVIQYDHLADEKQVLFVINRARTSKLQTIRYTNERCQQRYFEVNMCSNSISAVVIKKGRISSALLKCTNDQEKTSAKPFLSVQKQALGSDCHCDLAFVDHGDYMEVSVTNIAGKDCTEVTVPVAVSSIKNLFALDNNGIREPVLFVAHEEHITFLAEDISDNFKRYFIVLKKRA